MNDTIEKNQGIRDWADGVPLKLMWRKMAPEVRGWLRKDGHRAIESGDDVLFDDVQGFGGLWASGDMEAMPSEEFMRAEYTGEARCRERVCSNYVNGCDGFTDGAMHGRLTRCQKCEDEERVAVAMFLGDGVKRLPTIHEVAVLRAEFLQVFKVEANGLVIPAVARLGEHVFGQFKRLNGELVCLLGAEW